MLTVINRARTGLGLNDPARRETSRYQLQTIFRRHTFSCNTFQKCETKLQTCPIVNLPGAALWNIRRRQKKISRRNRLRAECASRAKSEKSLQPQKNKGSGREFEPASPRDSPNGGIIELRLRRYSKIHSKSRAFISFLQLAAARAPIRLSREKAIFTDGHECLCPKSNSVRRAPLSRQRKKQKMQI